MAGIDPFVYRGRLLALSLTFFANVCELCCEKRSRLCDCCGWKRICDAGDRS